MNTKRNTKDPLLKHIQHRMVLLMETHIEIKQKEASIQEIQNEIEDMVRLKKVQEKKIEDAIEEMIHGDRSKGEELQHLFNEYKKVRRNERH